MSGPSAQSLWDRLQEQGLVQGEMPPAGDIDSPWYVRTMQGVAGWLGASFLLGFVGVGLGLIMESIFASFLMGAGLCAAAWMLFRYKPGSDFATQFAFAVSLTGQFMILFAVARQLEMDIRAVAALSAVLQAILFILIANFLHRVWSAASGGLAAILAASGFGLYPMVSGALALALAAVWLNEFRLPRHAAGMRALGYGLVLATLLFLHTPPHYWSWSAAIRGEQLALPMQWPAVRWVSTALIALALLWTAWQFLERQVVRADSRAGLAMLAVSLLLATLSYKAPGVGVSCIILVIGFGNGNRVLTGLGIFALLAYLSQYYYLMQVSLLEKSLWMLGSGAALLLAWGLLGRVWPAREGDSHA